jgi:hypothetical protein
MTIAEREEWANYVRIPDISHTVISTSHAIKYRLRIPKEYDETKAMESHSQTLKKIHNLISSLRLLKDKYFDDYCLIMKIDLNIPRSIMSYGSQYYTIFEGPVKYVLSKTDKPILVKNFNLIDRLSSYNLINNAFQWLNTYSKEHDQIKRVIYLAIVLETLLSDTPEAVTHKLRCRSANLLEASFREKKKIYDNINQFYTTRSNMLHGRDSRPFEGISTTDQIVRKILKHVLRAASNFDVKEQFDPQYANFLHQLDFGIAEK